MNKKLILSRLIVSSCWLGLLACQGQLDVVDDTVGSDNSDLTGDENETNAPLPAPGSFAKSIDFDCPCAQSATLRALTCGRGAPPAGNDIIQTTADGGIVAFNLCDGLLDTNCTVAYWQATSGTWDLGKGFLIGLDGNGDTLAVQTEAGTSFVDTSGESQTFDISPIIGRGSFSRDGRSLLGSTFDNNVQTLARAKRGGGVEGLVELGDVLITRAVVTPSGDALAGDLLNRFGATEAGNARWTSEGGLTDEFGALPDGAEFPFVKAISEDGSVIAGHLAPSFGAFRWTEATGIVEIGPSWGETFLSADGSVQLGGDNLGNDERNVYRWQDATGAVSLVSGTKALAIGMSADGSVVAGRLEDGGSTRTFIWDAQNGTRQLKTTLDFANVDTSDWKLGEPRVLSADGKVLIGDALCDGLPAVYRVELPE